MRPQCHVNDRRPARDRVVQASRLGELSGDLIPTVVEPEPPRRSASSRPSCTKRASQSSSARGPHREPEGGTSPANGSKGLPPPNRVSAWACRQSSGAAFAAARQGTGRPPADPVRRLDGRHVTDVSAPVRALGEAVAGPGGHYHQCRGTLRGCRCGGEWPPAPFTPAWHDAEVARRALASVSVDTAGETPYVDMRARTRPGEALDWDTQPSASPCCWRTSPTPPVLHLVGPTMGRRGRGRGPSRAAVSPSPRAQSGFRTQCASRPDRWTRFHSVG